MYSEDPFTPVEEVFTKMTYLEQYVAHVLDYTSKYNNKRSGFYAPENLIGKCEVYPEYGDSVSTYLLRTYGTWWKESEAYQKNYKTQDEDPLGAEDYVTVLFRHAVVPRDVFIYETYNPGAVVRIWGRLKEQQWRLLWKGEPQVCPEQARKFVPKIYKTNCLIDQLRLEFNQSHLNYYTSIDAILLGGVQPKTVLQYNLLAKNFIDCCIKKEEPKALSNNDEDRPDLFSHLPYEVLVHIFGYLDLKSLSRCAQLNKRLNHATFDRFLYECISLKTYWNMVNYKTLQYFTERCTSLRKLDLSWCDNENDNMTSGFIDLIHRCGRTLTHLSLVSCYFINEAAIKEIGEHCVELTEIRLRNFQEKYPSDLIWLANLKTLITLELFACDIRTNILVNILKVNEGLKHINIDFCEKLDMDCVIKAATVYNKNLITWSSWKTLNLTADGAKHFSKSSNLKELDLGWCLLLEDPENCLTEIAEGCPELRRLVISGWRAADDEVLLPVIYHCKKLIQLELVGLKSITERFCERALGELPDLRLLDVSFCDVTNKQVQGWRERYPEVIIKKTHSNDSWV